MNEEEPPDITPRIITPPRILYVAGESERQNAVYGLLKYGGMDCDRITGLNETKRGIDTGKYRYVFVMTYNGKGQVIVRYAIERGLGAAIVSGAENAKKLEKIGVMVLSGDVDNLRIYNMLPQIREFFGYNGNWKKSRSDKPL